MKRLNYSINPLGCVRIDFFIFAYPYRIAFLVISHTYGRIAFFDLGEKKPKINDFTHVYKNPPIRLR
jgi:hypothetical protein